MCVYYIVLCLTFYYDWFVANIFFLSSTVVLKKEAFKLKLRFWNFKIVYMIGEFVSFRLKTHLLFPLSSMFLLILFLIIFLRYSWTDFQKLCISDQFTICTFHWYQIIVLKVLFDEVITSLITWNWQIYGRTKKSHNIS